MFTKKTLALILMLCVMFTGVAAVNAQTETDLFAGKTPITQADIDAFVLVIPQIAAADGDFSIISNAYKQAGWDDLHGNYVVTKIRVAHGIVLDPTQQEAFAAQLPASLFPNAAEIELVKANVAKINAAQSAPMRAVSTGDDFLADQLPLAQADINSFIKIHPALNAPEASYDDIIAAYKSVGWDEIRSSYVIAKISYAQKLIEAGNDTAEIISQIPPPMVPTDDEIALVQLNLPRLKALK